MDKLLALFFLAVGLVYGDLEAGTLVHAWLFPGLAAAAALYLLRPRGAIVLTLAAGAFYLSDFTGDSLLRALVLPVVGILCVGYLLYWLGVSTGVGGFFIGGDGDGGCDGGGDGGGGGD